jgi:ubiquitin conjugation factor E4 B
LFRTGGNNQFYEKFTIRYRISEVLEYLWFSNDLFRNAIIAECSNQALFLRFVTLLTNDATFLLDEAIHKLEEIHELEKLRENQAQWNALNPDQQNEKV